MPHFLKALAKELKMITTGHKVFTEGEGLILQSGPGRRSHFQGYRR